MKKFFLLLFLFPLCHLNSQEIIPEGSTWYYLKGKSDISTSWISENFSTSTWSAGKAPFRYGDGSGGTELTDMQNSYTTVFLRKVISVDIPDSLIGDIIARVSYDDGFRLWINGIEAASKNAPAASTYDAVAPTAIETITDTITISSSKVNLKNGKNVICVLVYNCSLSSSDLFFDISLTVQQPMPKGPEVNFSHPGGYYNSNFTLTLSSPNAGDTIKYTLDYSDPATSSTALSGKSPLNLLINPDNTANRPLTPAVVVRSCVVKSGYKTRNSETRTYIFTEKIKTQTFPGSGWPNSYEVNSQAIYYDVDSRVVNDARYQSIFNKVFSSIPTVCIVTDNKNLFDASSGIYVNALNHGDAWERPATLELIEKNNKEAFAVNVGLRIRGGYSRNSWNPKHAFRIFFKDSYGKKRLNYPIFGPDAAQDFKKFDFRCAQNYSWSFYNNTYMTYAQDETCRAIQGLMGHPYSRSRYCHLFLNGMYWGLYEFQERPEANFAESYKGGSDEDYDVIKVAPDNGYNIEATDGTLGKWQQLYSLTNRGFDSDDNYFFIQGLNSNGNIDTSYEKLVDIDNLIDYMINIFYSGNFDSPVTEFGDNVNPNNFYAIKNRNSKREGFFFIVHDAEHTFNYVAGSEEGKNQGVYENRVDLINDGMSQPTSLYRFHPQWLHYKLTKNTNYRLRFADHAVKYLYNNGLLTPTNVANVFRSFTQQIDTAIIGESARWGYSNGSSLRTRDDDWIPAVNNTISNFINKRTPIVINQLKSAQLLPALDFPIIKKDDIALTSNIVQLNSTTNINIVNPNSSGSIIYTIDGSDPRTVKGNVSENAIITNSPAELSIDYPTVVRARIKNNDEWSALTEVIFTNKNNRDKIKITEVQFNPPSYGAFGSKSLEFIELKNTSNEGVDIGGCRLDSAVKFTFPKYTIIPPGEFVVIAGDISAFEYTFFMSPSGRFTNNLANEGERIVLLDEDNNALINFKYDTVSNWPFKKIKDGCFSYVAAISNPTGDPNNPEYWKASAHEYGSPFSDDNTYVKKTEIIPDNLVCDIYPNPVNDYFFIKATGTRIRNIQIYDIRGQLIYFENIRNANNYYKIFNLNELKMDKGVYILQIINSNKRITKKIIVQ